MVLRLTWRVVVGHVLFGEVCREMFRLFLSEKE